MSLYIFNVYQRIATGEIDSNNHKVYLMKKVRELIISSKNPYLGFYSRSPMYKLKKVIK